MNPKTELFTPCIVLTQTYLSGRGSPIELSAGSTDLLDVCDGDGMPTAECHLDYTSAMEWCREMRTTSWVSAVRRGMELPNSWSFEREV